LTAEPRLDRIEEGKEVKPGQITNSKKQLHEDRAKKRRIKV